MARLAENIDLPGLADDLVRLGGPTGANPGAKITTTVLGMAAGADSITDLDLLRHGATPRLWWVTSGAAVVHADEHPTPATAAVWGLGRTVMQELPQLRCVLVDVDSASYFLSKLELVAGDEPTMSPWRKRLFIATSYITADAAAYFNLPLDRTVVIGSRIEV